MLTLGLSGLASCELFVGFDRAEIDGGSLDLMQPDGGCFGNACDAQAPLDGTMGDSSMDAPVMDSPADTTIQDSGTDTSVADANDAGVDAADASPPPDSGPDAGADADDGATTADADDGSTSDASDANADADPDAGD